MPRKLPPDWYYEPGYALMREFIHRHRGAGLGPDGEWGRLPEAHSRLLGEWIDQLYLRVTQCVFESLHMQLIDEERADADSQSAKVKAKAYTVKKSKSKPQQRRVPTLIDGWHDSAATGAEIPLESPASSIAQPSPLLPFLNHSRRNYRCPPTTHPQQTCLISFYSHRTEIETRRRHGGPST